MTESLIVNLKRLNKIQLALIYNIWKNKTPIKARCVYTINLSNTEIISKQFYLNNQLSNYHRLQGLFERNVIYFKVHFVVIGKSNYIHRNHLQYTIYLQVCVPDEIGEHLFSFEDIDLWLNSPEDINKKLAVTSLRVQNILNEIVIKKPKDDTEIKEVYLQLLKNLTLLDE